MHSRRRRVLLTITTEVKQELEHLKQARFYNVSYSAMIRELIGLGLETAKENGYESK